VHDEKCGNRYPNENWDTTQNPYQYVFAQLNSPLPPSRPKTARGRKSGREGEIARFTSWTPTLLNPNVDFWTN